MKKVLSLFFVLIMCLSLCACGKSKAVKSVEAQIEELANVTYENRDMVTAARQAYTNLSKEDREAVENVEILVQAEQRMVDEEEKLVDSIASGSDPYEAIEKLRQMGSTEYIRTKIAELGIKIVRDYVLENGYACDYRGKADPSEDYKAIEIREYYLMANPKYETVNLVYSDSTPTNRMLLSKYEITRRDHSLIISSKSGSYKQTEWIDEGWKYAGYATLSKSFSWKYFGLDTYSFDVDFSDMTIWPYSKSEEYMEENLNLDVEAAIEKMDDCLLYLEMPVTAWELFGGSHS